MTWARLTFGLQRPTMIFAMAMCLGLAAVSTWLAWNIGSMRAQCETGDAIDCGMLVLFGSPLGDPVLLTQLAISVTMYVVPLVLGVPVLAQEIESRTAMVSWPLAGSRLRWLAWRAGSILIIGVVLLGIMGLGAELLTRASDTGNLEPGFLAYGSRGISLVMRSAFMLVIAITLGGVIGRLMPALLIGGALAVGLSTVLNAAPPYGVSSTELEASSSAFEDGHSLQTSHSYRRPDGSPMTDDEAEALLMAVFEQYSPELPPESALPQDVFYGVSASRYFQVVTREALLLGGAVLLVAGLAASVVQRRRPE